MKEHSFFEIDAKREKLGVKQVELCRMADVNEGTYSKAKQEGREPMPRIRRKLWAALDAIAEERGVAVVDEVRHAAE